MQRRTERLRDRATGDSLFTSTDTTNTAHHILVPLASALSARLSATPGAYIEAPKETGRLKDAALLARLQAGLCLQGGRYEAQGPMRRSRRSPVKVL